VSTWSKDDIARIIIRVGRDMGITERGIVIGLSVGLVESNLTVYANAKVPGSLDLPHDAVGSDGKSVGVQQQQVVWGNGAWWWGDVATCQDPESSTRLFFERLARRDYNRGDAGAHAQAVQGSAFPDRYGQRMGEAQQIYDRLAGGVVAWYDKDRSMEFGFGGPRSTANLVGICLHTTESAPGATADDVTSYQVRSETGSYNVMVDDHTTILQNTDSWVTWSTGNKGNYILLHLCFVGRAAWSRAEWMSHMPMLQRGAKVAAHWCRTYGWPARWVDVWHLPGITTHDATRAWGGTDHTDPGPNFPHDVFCQMVQNILDGNSPQEDEMTPDQARKLDRIYFELTERFQSRVRDENGELSPYRDTMAGYALQTDAATYRTEVAVAEVLDRLDAIDARVRKLEGK